MLFSASTSLIAHPSAGQPGLATATSLNAWNPGHRGPNTARIRSSFPRR